jgi:hypothetical protein
MGARRVSPSLTVATCDYAGRSYGWEPLSGQSARQDPAGVIVVRDLGSPSSSVRTERLRT